MALGMLAAGLPGCTAVRDSYSCTSDAACQDGSRAGHCELSGYCSFADASCAESGRRYGDYAADRSGTCVPLLARSFGGPDGDGLLSINVDQDRMLIAGFFGEGSLATDPAATRTAQFGNDKLVSNGGADGIIGRLFADGTPEWIMSFGADHDDEGRGILRRPNGSILAAGNYRGYVKLSSTYALPETVTDSTFVAAFDDAGGITHVSTPVDAFTHSGALAVDDAGDFIIAGTFWATILDFGDGQTYDAGQGRTTGIFVAKYDGATGGIRWVRGFANEPGGAGYGLGVSAHDDIVVVGWFSGGIDVSGGVLDAMGAKNAVALKLSKDGDLVWKWTLRGPNGGQSEGRAVTLLPDGDAIVSGTFSGDAEASESSRLTAVGMSDAFVVRLAGADATVREARRFGQAGTTIVTTSVVDAAGRLLLAGAFDGTLDLGSGASTSKGFGDVFIARFDASGPLALRWAEMFGGAGDDYPTSIAPDGDAIWVGGTFTDALPIGNTTLSGAKEEAFLIRFGP